MDNTEAPKVVRTRKAKTPKGGAVEEPPPPSDPPAPAADAPELVEDPVVEVDKPAPEVVVVPPEAPVRMSKPRGPYKPRVKKVSVEDSAPKIEGPPLDLHFWSALQHSLLAHQKMAKSSKYASMRIA